MEKAAGGGGINAKARGLSVDSLSYFYVFGDEPDISNPMIMWIYTDMDGMIKENYAIFIKYWQGFPS